MTTTNQAIMPASNSDNAGARMQLDLALDSILCLKQRSRMSASNIAHPLKVSGWLESSAIEGERWLRASAGNGDLYAMEKLGLRLLIGDGLPKSVEEGLEWLRKSAESGNPFAMEELAEYELDEDDKPGSSAEGERWLRNAVERGYRVAMVNLGTRLITGNGLASDAERGERLLCEAAQQGSQIAMIRLGTYLLSGWGLDHNHEEGLRWLRRAGATNADQLLELGLHLYQRSLTGTIKAARGLAKEASVLFQEALRQGNRTAALNLTYLLRRFEIKDASFPSLDELLSDHLEQNHPFALVNQALRLARGIQCNTDWKAADALFGKLRDSGDVLEWWFARSREGDPEGHLVTGWLGRHQLATDPDGFQIAQRMELARNGGWPVPEWMNDSVTLRNNA
jgi:TPR repeat protein